MEEVSAIIEERPREPALRLHQRSRQRPRSRRISSVDRELFDQIFGICGRPRCRQRAARAGRRPSTCCIRTPDQLEQLIRDPALIPDALEECPSSPPVMAISPSRAIAMRKHRDRRAPASSGAWWCGRHRLAPNYDPDVFSRSGALRHSSASRSGFLIPSVAGPHHCIGNILGRTTITIANPPACWRGFPKAHLIDPGFTPVLRRRGRRIAAAKPADENPLK